jgi:glutamate racemase
MGPDVRLIDSAEETAAEAARTLAGKGLSAPEASPAVYRFVASDDPDQFLRVGQRFLGGAVENVEIRTLG